MLVGKKWAKKVLEKPIKRIYNKSVGRPFLPDEIRRDKLLPVRFRNLGINSEVSEATGAHFQVGPCGMQASTKLYANTGEHS